MPEKKFSPGKQDHQKQTTVTVMAFFQMIIYH